MNVRLKSSGSEEQLYLQIIVGIARRNEAYCPQKVLSLPSLVA